MTTPVVDLQMWRPHQLEQAIGGLAAFFVVSRSFTHIYRHLRYNKSVNRVCTVRILALVPLFALDAWAALMLQASKHGWAEPLTLIRELYEAIAMVSFLQLILTYLGGPHALAIALRADAASQDDVFVRHRWPLDLIMRPYRLGPDFVAHVTLGILQYVPVTVLLFATNVIMWGSVADQEELRMQHSYLHIVPGLIKAVSCGWAMYHVVLLYLNTKPYIAPMQPFLKFLSFKGIIFFTFWQGFVISILAQLHVIPRNPLDPKALVWSQAQIAAGIKNFLLCLEMVAFCEMHRHAYPIDEASSCIDDEGPNAKAHVFGNVLKATNFVDVVVLYREVRELHQEAVAHAESPCIGGEHTPLVRGEN